MKDQNQQPPDTAGEEKGNPAVWESENGQQALKQPKEKLCQETADRGP